MEVLSAGRFFVLILVAVFLRQGLAAKHAVGGSQGWDESTDFDSWASAQTFKVGDELEFKYTAGLHNVAELPNESAFKSCDIGVAVDSLNGGSNKIKLTKPGVRYFACGTSGHCQQGMKVKITAVSADASPSSSTPTATSPPDSSAAQLQLLNFIAYVASSVLSFVLFM
ncbi:hypothetical protein ACS0TY_000419 [Phlomoides rotata]